MTALLASLLFVAAGGPSFQLRLLGEGSLDTRADGQPSAGLEAQSPGAGEEVAELRAEMFARARVQVTPWLSATLAGLAGLRASEQGPAAGQSFHLWNGADGHAVVEERLVELSAQVAKGVWSVRAGKQFVRWGATTLLSPIDVITPLDLRRGALGMRSADPDAPYLGVWALRATAEPGPALLEIVWVPVFTPDRISLVSGDWALIDTAGGRGLRESLRQLRQVLPAAIYDRLGPETLTPQVPGPGLSSSQAGARAGLRGDGWMAALHYYFGFEAYPAVTVNTTLVNQLVGYYEKDPALRDPRTDFDFLLERLEAGETLVSGGYRRRHTVGASGEMNVGDLRLAADLAWSPRSTVYARSGRAAGAGMTAGALSVDYLPSERFSLTAGLHATRFALDGPPAELAFGWTTHQLAASLGLQASVGDSVRVQLLGLSELDRFSLFGTLLVGYRPTETVEVYLAGDLIAGGDSSIGGRFDHNDQVSIGLRASY